MSTALSAIRSRSGELGAQVRAHLVHDLERLGAQLGRRCRAGRVGGGAASCMKLEQIPAM
jgi:hypothetical protein